MELQGKVRMLLEPKSGISQSSGNSWMSQEVVLDYFWWPNQSEASQAVMRIFGEERIKQYNLQPNDEVNVRYHIEAHEYQGRWFNEVRIDGITFLGASASKNPQPQNQPAQQANTQAAGQQPTAAPSGPQQAPFPPQVDANGNPQEAKNDDLPF